MSGFPAEPQMLSGQLGRHDAGHAHVVRELGLLPLHCPALLQGRGRCESVVPCQFDVIAKEPIAVLQGGRPPIKQQLGGPTVEGCGVQLLVHW